jgi:hypothetical protein
VIDVNVLIINYQGLARLSCSGNINSAQTKTIPTMIAMTSILDFHSRTRICLYKQGFIDLSGILQAAKCQAASSESKAVANPSTTYATLSNTLINAIFSNILAKIMTKRYKIIGDNTLQMISIGYDS